jgi:hypothetical protein
MPSWKKVIVSGSDATLNSVTATAGFTGSLLGNASTATSAATWTTGRTITIGNTGKTVNGSGNVSWTLSEIGAYAATNPSGYTNNTGTVTSIATGNGITGGTIVSTGTLGLTGQALALHNLGTSGIIARTGAGTVAARTITGTTNQITVTNGNGVSGNPTISLPSTINVNTSGNAANVTGTVAVANGGTGQTTYTNGQLLIGNTTGNTLTKATLTAGSGITITNGNGSISIAATGGGIGGSGTTNYLAKFTGTTTVGNSSIADNGSVITSTVGHTFNSHIFTDSGAFVVRNGTYAFGGDFDASGGYGSYAQYGGVTSNTDYINIVNTWADNRHVNGQILTSCFSGENLLEGQLVRMRSDGAWYRADAGFSDGSTTLLGIALESVTSPDKLSVLLDGIIATDFHDQLSTTIPGKPLYISTSAGYVTETAPTTTGEFVRLVGHNIYEPGLGLVVIRFQPDSTWLEL